MQAAEKDKSAAHNEAREALASQAQLQAAKTSADGHQGVSMDPTTSLGTKEAKRKRAGVEKEKDLALEKDTSASASHIMAISAEREAIAAERAGIVRERAAIDKERVRFDMGWEMIEKGKAIIRQEMEKLVAERLAWEKEREREKQGLAKRKSDQDARQRELDARETEKGASTPNAPRGVEQIIEEEIQRAARDEIEKIRGAWVLSLADAEKGRMEIERIKAEWEKERERQLKEREDMDQDRLLLERIKATLLPGTVSGNGSGKRGASDLSQPSPGGSRSALAEQHLQQAHHHLLGMQLPHFLQAQQQHLQQQKQQAQHQQHQQQQKSETGVEPQRHSKRRRREEEDERSPHHQHHHHQQPEQMVVPVDDDDEEYDSPSVPARKERKVSAAAPEGDYDYSSEYVRSRTRRTWEERYEELKQFKQKHGHLYIPYSGNMKQLYEWVSTQRKNHRKKVLKKERFLLLDALGFPWTGKRELLAAAKNSASSPPRSAGAGSVASLLGPSADDAPQPSSSLLSSLASLANEERGRGKALSEEDEEDDPSSGDE